MFIIFFPLKARIYMDIIECLGMIKLPDLQGMLAKTSPEVETNKCCVSPFFVCLSVESRLFLYNICFRVYRVKRLSPTQ